MKGLSKKKEEDILAEARKRFKLAVDAESEQRELSIDDINFRHGDQWDESAKQTRKQQQRPCLTINKMEQRVDQVTGDQRMNRMGALIRTTNGASSNNESYDLAQAMMGVIKGIEHQCMAKTAYDTAFDHAVGHGFGFWRIVTEFSDDDSFEQDIVIKRVQNSMRVYLDPTAEHVTKMDAKWGFVTKLVDKDEYPNASWDYGRGEEWSLWKEDGMNRVAEYFRLVPEKKIVWLIDGKTIVVKDKDSDIRDELTADGVVPAKQREIEVNRCEWYEISACEVFKKKDFPSKYIPIIPCYGKELNVQGKTFYRGVIRHAKDPQRIYNYTRSASVEQVALTPKAPYIVEENQLGNHKQMWETANTVNYSALVYKHKAGVPMPVRVPPPQPSAGWIAESNLSDADIDAASGLYKASLGAPSNERSGKAINARKTEGDVGTFHFHDNRALSLQHSYTVLVDMIPRVYDNQRMVDIVRPDDKDDVITLNQTVVDRQTGEIKKVFDLSMGKYHITVDVGASYTTQREMASQSMMELIQYAPQLAERVLDLIAKNLDWPGADEIAARLEDKRLTPQEVQVEIQKAVEGALQARDLDQKDEELEIKRYEATTKRINQIASAMNDDDELELELIKLLDENGTTDQETRNHVMGLATQIRDQRQLDTIQYENLYTVQ